MCCIVAALGLVGPRLAFAIWWLTDKARVVTALGGHWWVALLGLLFLPWTALAWVAAWAPTTHVSGVGWLIVGLGFLFDLSSTGGGRSSRSRSRSRT
jgi:hypothetical protein